MATQLLTNHKFTGLNLFDAPPDLAAGELTQADNVLIDGGDAILRPGLVGMFTTPLSGPLYTGTAYIQPNGSTQILLESAGRVYTTLKKSATYSEVAMPGAGSLNSAGSRWARLGRFAYRVAPNDPLLRTDLLNNSVAMALAAPISGLTSSLSNQALARLVDKSPSSGSGTATELLPSTSLADDSHWTGAGTTSDKGDGGYWMDQSGDSRMLTTAAPNPAYPDDPTRYPNQFQVSFRVAHTNGSDSPWDAGTLTMFVYGDTAGTALLSSLVFNFNGDVATRLNTFDFSSLTTDILSFNLKWQTTVDHNFHGYTAVAPSLKTLAEGFQVVSSGGEVVVGPGSYFFNGSGIACAGAAIKFDLGAHTNWSAYNRITLPLDYSPSVVGGLRLALRFQQDSSTDTYDSNTMTISTDGTSASVDISAAIPSAIRADFRYLSVVVLDNLTFTTEPDTLFGLTSIIAAGNLTIGYAPYSWVVTEVNDVSATFGQAALLNVIESNPGPDSLALTPVNDKAEGALQLPAGPANVGASCYHLWRRGGVFSDGAYRLLATLPIGTDTPILSSPDVSLTWNHTTRSILDNTPDTALIDTDLLVQGRDLPPIGGQAICAWQSRICIAQGGTLYLSWLIEQDLQGALYFTNLNDPTDPLAAVKGAQFPVGLDDNDPILALIPLGTNAYFSKGFLVIVKQRSVWLLSGTDPSNFALQEYLTESGVGCVAGRAAVQFDNVVGFLSSDGAYAFNGNEARTMSLKIETALDPSQYAPGSSAMLYHDRRLILLTPGLNGTTNSIAWVWDTRQKGWTRWTSMALTSGVTLSTRADSNEAFFGGYDGQLYALTEASSVDKHVPTDAGTAISVTVASRGFGQERDGSWRLNRAEHAAVQIQTMGSFTPTIALSSESALLWSQTYTYDAGTNSGPVLRVSQPARGEYGVLSVTGAANAALRIKALSVTITDGGRQ